ncbi:AAA family ATPase [Pantoea cypripedii]|uniref:AAA family ATPase n=1 Tax=Pantoea cypripedii TaxID=55209 RepID=A0A1X1EK34_PANCY|nr:AAA family ATPase [Pantoea cypripedii]MBP2198826.1 adenylate kinase family enzyme [Pantoea cypripedii]ORM89275.1 AAA family ATPase [Pantoea cypripedii]
MNTIIPLEALGPRICIMGPSNSGKSTLAEAIARKTSLPAIHLDRLYHMPDSNWVPRDTAEFLRLHSDAVSQEKWVMDGNYKKCIPERLERATGFILLDLPTHISLLRYIRRCYSANPRVGGLKIGREHIKWDMIKHITLVTPGNRKSYKIMYEQIPLPKLLLATPENVNEYFKHWKL